MADVTLTGTGFRSAGAKAQTKIGAGTWTDATWKASPAVTDTSGVITVPTDTAGTITIRVNADAGASEEKTFTVTEAAQAPALESIAPDTAEVA